MLYWQNKHIIINYIYFRHPLAANLYPWSTAESLMRLARRSSTPPLPDNLQQLAIIFKNKQLPRYNCCDITIFRSCVQYFKVVPARMGYQMLTIHVMIQNYISLFPLK